MFGYTYTKSAKITTPAGLTLETSFDKEYEDTDDDGVPETITSLITVNNRTSQAVHDVRNSTRTATTPEGRTATSVYDPLTLLTLRSEVPGLSRQNIPGAITVRSNPLQRAIGPPRTLTMLWATWKQSPIPCRR